MSAGDVFAWTFVAFFVLMAVGVGAVLISEFAFWLYDEIDDRRK